MGNRKALSGITAKIKEAILEVNSSLNEYEAGIVSVKRFSDSEIERVYSFDQYIEARFNFVMSYVVPELSLHIEAFRGRLFKVIKIENPDEKRYKFDNVIITLDPDKDNFLGYIEEYDAAVEGVFNILGGIKKISFASAPKRIKLRLE